MTTTLGAASSSQAYHPAPAAPGDGPRPASRQALLGRLDDALETSHISADTAARWTSGVVGLGMFASAATYGARGHRHDEQVKSLVGGAVGLCLYAAGMHDILQAAHIERDPDGQANRLAHHALLSLGGVAIGCALSAVDNPIVGLFGAFGAYFSAYWATSALTAQMAWREARWRGAGPGEAHGSRFLTAAATLTLVATAFLAWVGTAVGTAVGGGSPAAGTGRLVGAGVTLFALLQVLPRLLSCRPPPAPVDDDVDV